VPHSDHAASQAGEVTIDSAVRLLPTGDGGFKLAVTLDVSSLELTASNNAGDGALETCRIPDGEELLRVRSTACAAHLLGQA
jgi:hypothetical protein